MNFDKLISKLMLLFKKVKTPYMLVGGFAVAVWGYPRQSLDIDIVVELTEAKIDDFLSFASKLGFVLDKSEVDIIVKLGNRFVMELDNFRIDCWLPKSEFDKDSLKRCKKEKLFGKTLNVIGPEDLIISKLLAGRALDVEDIKTVLIRQEKSINKKYLREQSMKLNILDSLEKIINFKNEIE